jgi:Common central domain of tyrosinase
LSLFGYRNRTLDSMHMEKDHGKAETPLRPEHRIPATTFGQGIIGYVNENVRVEHANAHTWHHAGNPAFFDGHRQFIAKLEAFLLQQGLAQFVPLPKWDPSTTIPVALRVVKVLPAVTAAGFGATIANASPNLPMPASLNNLSGFSTAAALSTDAQLQAWHGNVHVTVGGAMANVVVSPCAAVFWVWHAFIDDIYEEWLALQRLPEIGDVLHYVYPTSDGRIWHAIRIRDGRWSLSGDVEAQVGDAGSYLGLGADAPAGPAAAAPEEIGEAGTVTCTIELAAYNPGFWNNDPVVQYNNNCYNYASNWRTNTFAQPGRGCGQIYTSLTCSEVTRAALCDGMHRRYDCFPDSERPRYLVALMVWPGRDYHWMRKMKENFWGHKPGSTPVRNVDSSGNVISDPATCDRGPYTEFCGYFYGCNSQRQRIR